MEGHGVIMECFVPGKSGKISNLEDLECLSCSGLYLGGGLILTHGTVVTDILRHPAALPLLKALHVGRCVRAEDRVEGVNGKDSGEGKVRVEEERESRVKNEVHQDEGDILNTAVSIIGARFQAILPTSIDSRVSGELIGVHAPTSHSLDLKRKQQDGTKPRTSPLSDQKVSTPPVLTTKPPVLPQPPLSPSYRTLPARLERLYILPGLREKIEGLMPASEGWKFEEEEQEREKKRGNPHIQNIILSTFVLLRIIPDDTCGTGVVADVEIAEVTQGMMASSCLVHKGATLHIESSPFGSLSPGVFLNSLSRGVVSNTTGPLLLTDARSVVGSEGAPVFTSVRGSWQLCAMVVSPFCWQRGEWIGLTLLVAISPILRALLHSCNQSEGPSMLQDKTMGSKIVKQGALSPSGMRSIEKCERHEEHLVKDVERAVVGVGIGRGWGSGVVVAANPPLVITCAHVTLPSISGKVTLMLHDGRRVEGRVLHQTQPVTPGSQAKGAAVGKSIWDLAVVEASEPLPATLTIASTLPYPGTEVMVVGYGMFRPATLPSPSFSKGIISRVLTAPSSALIWPSFPPPLPHPTLTQPHSDKVQLTKGQQFSEACDSTPRLNNSSSYTSQDNRSESSTNNRTLKKITSLTRGNEEIRGRELVTHSPGGREWSTEDIHLHTHSHGTLGRVECNGRPTGARSVAVVMQTTCSVYAGTSGGPVVTLHPTQGPQVVGIVACNTRDYTNKANFPQVNLAVPTPLLGGIIAAYLESRDLAVLRLLDVECPTASHLWAIGDKPQAKL